MSAEVEIRLRRARPTDLDLLRHWDTQPHVIASGGLDDGLDWAVELARDVDWQEVLIAELAGRPIGVIQVIDPAREESHYWGEIEPDLRALDIWIGEAADLDRGYGTQMMRIVLDRCFDDPHVNAVVIDPLASNTNAIRFYHRMGFTEVGPLRFGFDDCLVMRIERWQWLGQEG